MAHDNADDNGKILRARLLDWMQKELEQEADNALAIRKALLAAIFASPSTEPSVARFNDFLLSEFGPLADHFSDELHPFMNEQSVRRFDRDGLTEMLVHQSLPEAIMAEPLTGDDILAAGLRLPWEATDKRLVGCFLLHGFYQIAAKTGLTLDEINAELSDAIASIESFGPWKDEPEGPLNYPGCWIRALHLGDVILVFSRDGSQRSQVAMHLAAQTLFTRATRLGFGLRGGVEFGTCTVDFDQGHFVGFPMLAARQLAAKQAWFGVAFDPSTREPMTREAGSATPPDIGDWIPIVVPYAVPIGIGSETEELDALNWAMIFKDDPDGVDAFVDQLHEMSGQNAASSKQNTRAFGYEMLRRMAEKSW